GQGPVGGGGRRPPRAEERDDPGGHCRGPSALDADRRYRDHGEHLRPSRHGEVPARRHHVARLPGHPGHQPVSGGRRHRGAPGDRPRIRLPRSAYPVRMSRSAQALPMEDRRAAPAAAGGPGAVAYALGAARRKPLGVLGGGLILLLVATALLAPVLAPYDPIKTQSSERPPRPSPPHPLGP